MSILNSSKQSAELSVLLSHQSPGILIQSLRDGEIHLDFSGEYVHHIYYSGDSASDFPVITQKMVDLLVDFGIKDVYTPELAVCSEPRLKGEDYLDYKGLNIYADFVDISSTWEFSNVNLFVKNTTYCWGLGMGNSTKVQTKYFETGAQGMYDLSNVQTEYFSMDLPSSRWEKVDRLIDKGNPEEALMELVQYVNHRFITGMSSLKNILFYSFTNGRKYAILCRDLRNPYLNTSQRITKSGGYVFGKLYIKKFQNDFDSQLIRWAY